MRELKEENAALKKLLKEMQDRLDWTPPHCDQGQSKPMDRASSEIENAQFDIDTFLRDFDTYIL